MAVAVKNASEATPQSPFERHRLAALSDMKKALEKRDE